LFEEDFEAWIHGPVIPKLYHHYKEFGWRPIMKDVDPRLPVDVWDFLEELSEGRCCINIMS
jgi:uncharacterized phage-associated protein